MHRDIAFGGITLAFLTLLGLSYWQQDMPSAAPMPQVRVVPFDEDPLPAEMFEPEMSLAGLSRFEAVQNWGGSKRGERLLPAPEEPAAPGAAPAETGSATLTLSAGSPGSIDLLDGLTTELTAPVPSTAVAMAEPSDTGIMVRPARLSPGVPATAVQAIATTFRGVARRIEEGTHGSLLSFN